MDYTSNCGCQSQISATEVLKEIIETRPKKRNYILKHLKIEDMQKLPDIYLKTLKRSNPLVYDLNNYNINSFDVGKGHRCLGIELDAYMKKY